jgi:hypothetical protein
MRVKALEYAIFNVYQIPLDCVPYGIMKRKTLGLRTLGQHEIKDCWPAYPWAPKWDENRWWAWIAW